MLLVRIEAAGPKIGSRLAGAMSVKSLLITTAAESHDVPVAWCLALGAGNGFPRFFACRGIWSVAVEGGSMISTHDRVKSSGGKPSDASQPIRFAGSVLDAQRHVCAFFHNPEEEYRVLLPFIKDGFEQGEKAFHIIDPKLRAEHCQRLASVGIDVDTAE